MPTQDEIRRWSLVLDAEDIPYELAQTSDGWTIVVAADDAPRAAEVLGAYYAENRERLEAEAAAAEPEEPDADAPAPGLLAAPLAVAAMVALIAFDVLVVRSDATDRWFIAGAADAERIRAGEWWRVVTALTLHADLVHLFTNAVTGSLLLWLVFLAVGPGAGGLLVLLAGALGNLANAHLRGADHVAVGASTALFGGLGLLAGLALRPGRVRLGRGRWGWAPLFAALMLLALTGLGIRTDIMAHLLGFAAGLGLGLLAGGALSGPPRRGRQALLGLAALLAIAVCWVLALDSA
jgi:membrane associated rhomboid family serine protease